MTTKPVPTSSTGVTHGEVITNPWVVALILDLAGYTPAADLSTVSVTEPSAGTGAFLREVTRRLATSVVLHKRRWTDEALHSAVRAYEIQPDNITSLVQAVISELTTAGCPAQTAKALAARWVVCDDYLLPAEPHHPADLVVGNPPYIRRDDLGAEAWARYATIAPTMRGRGDIYLGFFEVGLRTLRPNGQLAFICADRWMRNDYGKALRKLVTTGGYSVDTVISAHDVDAFTTQVSAYPAITLLRRGTQGPAVVANTTSEFGPDSTSSLVNYVTAGHTGAAETRTAPGVTAAWLPHWHAEGSNPWPTGSPETLAWIDRVDASFPTIEEAGGSIGIGIATGADQVYITDPGQVPDIEPDRLLPLACRADLRTGEFDWTGRYLVDVWGPDDRLVDIEQFPRLRAYLEAHLTAVKGRRVANDNPTAWWRTIDKVTHTRAGRRLVLLPDIAPDVSPVVSPGGFYPHHNLYWIDVLDSGWTEEGLAGLFLSDHIHRQIAAHCVRMRGSSLRFQAQYLRRLRIPPINIISAQTMRMFEAAYAKNDRAAATRQASKLYAPHTLPQV